MEVEVDAARGLPCLTIVGLPDQAVKEARERIRAAILNSQFALPANRLTVNLAPADLRKEGGMFDLAMALGVLAATGQVDPYRVAGVVALGELALDGGLRPVSGVLPVALALRGTGRDLYLPLANAAEAALVDGVRIVPVGSLAEATGILAGTQPVPSLPAEPAAEPPVSDVDFSDVKGQRQVRRALEVAAAGSHHVLLVGPPGSGKTMMAQRLPTILPPLTRDEALEATAVYSVAGALNGRRLLVDRPFRAPHHSTSAVALIGGGTVPRPGEISLAHHGVLFLDELPEFSRETLESLRQPLEEGAVRVSRARHSTCFPSRFTLVAAMNPCPCGYMTSPVRQCQCTAGQIQRYLSRISGPLLDRLDLHVEVPTLPADQLTAAPAEASSEIRGRVCAARERQTERMGVAGKPNARLKPREIRRHCTLTSGGTRLLRSAIEELGLSARSYDKLLRVARTIADLAGEEKLNDEHVAEAIQYRTLDRQLWA